MYSNNKGIKQQLYDSKATLPNKMRRSICNFICIYFFEIGLAIWPWLDSSFVIKWSAFHISSWNNRCAQQVYIIIKIVLVALVLVTFPIAETKCWRKLIEGRLMVGGGVSHSGEAWWQEYEAACHLSSVRKPGVTNPGAQLVFSFLFSPGPQAIEQMLPTVRVCLSGSANPV